LTVSYRRRGNRCASDQRNIVTLIRRRSMLHEKLPVQL